jgi:hypothetical protein
MNRLAVACCISLLSGGAALATDACKPITIETYNKAVSLMKEMDKISERFHKCNGMLDSNDPEWLTKFDKCGDSTKVDIEAYVMLISLFRVDLECNIDSSSETTELKAVRYRAELGSMTIVYKDSVPISVTQVGLR